MLRGLIAGVIALSACAIGMELLATTTWRVFGADPSVVGTSHLNSTLLIIGLGEACMAFLVYRLLGSGPVLWPSLLLLLFVVLGWATYHLSASIVAAAWNRYLLGYPAVLILGFWMGTFAMLTVQCWVTPRIPKSSGGAR